MFLTGAQLKILAGESSAEWPTSYVNAKSGETVHLDYQSRPSNVTAGQAREMIAQRKANRAAKANGRVVTTRSANPHAATLAQITPAYIRREQKRLTILGKMAGLQAQMDALKGELAALDS